MEELEQKLQGVWRRLLARERIVKEVIAGRLSLLEAAAHFRDLDQTADEIVRVVLRRRYPHCETDDERYCRYVIDYVEAEVDNDPGVLELVERLLEELDAHQSKGRLRLPKSFWLAERP
jgi:hypothetical protein